MSLSDYVTMAFDPALPPDPQMRARLDALKGPSCLCPISPCRRRHDRARP
jgi:hypothetical protein